MSETALPNDDLQPASETPAQTPAAPAKRAGTGLALFALLVGAAGVAIGGWGVWQVRHLQGATQQQR
ncbi:heme biosynthesis operon protein HemX, partial [Pseudomonas sp. MAFF212427]|nr:heme biosynthesis operon protein HemX [Pseudomonas brassicae]